MSRHSGVVSGMDGCVYPFTEERRERGERRRSAQGLFELRARRDGVGCDRRRQERRGLAAVTGRRLSAWWRGARR